MPVILSCRQHRLPGNFDWQQQGQRQDELNGIAAGTDFLTLADYQCPTCEAPKQDFAAVEKQVSGVS